MDDTGVVLSNFSRSNMLFYGHDVDFINTHIVSFVTKDASDPIRLDRNTNILNERTGI